MRSKRSLGFFASFFCYLKTLLYLCFALLDLDCLIYEERKKIKRTSKFLGRDL
jgi:hypothetical protein